MNESVPKFLPPSLRDPKRYIIFEVIADKPVEYVDISAALWSTMLEFLGELSSSEAKVWLVRNLYDPDKQRGVIRCASHCVEYTRACLALIHVIGETNSTIKVLGVTGTIKSAKTKYFGDVDGLHGNAEKSKV